MRQLAAVLLNAIIPEPTLARLRRRRARIRRHIAEPPRKRRYQLMIKLS
jgi:hypothetical protein